jgi:CrcB protein
LLQIVRMQIYLIIFLGAGFGGAFRHCVNQISVQMFGVGFPFGTFIVNVLGSLLMGILISFFAFKGELFQHSRLFFTTGVLGGFTTFSAYSLDIVTLYERGENMLAFEYALASVVLSVCAVLAGMWLIKQLFV